MSKNNELSTKWSLENLDLEKPLVDLKLLVNNSESLIDALVNCLGCEKSFEKIIFSHFNVNKVKDVNYYKKILLEQLKKLSQQKIIKFLNFELNGLTEELSYCDDSSENLKKNSQKAELERKKLDKSKDENYIKNSLDVKSDDLQFIVDDKEYEDFLNKEGFQNKNDNEDKKNYSKISKQKLIRRKNEDELIKKNKKKKPNFETEMEIKELEMRAKAIKALMLKSNEMSNECEKKNFLNQDLFENIDSEDEKLIEISEDKNFIKKLNIKDEIKDKNYDKLELNYLKDKNFKYESDNFKILNKEKNKFNETKQINDVKKIEKDKLSIESGEILDDLSSQEDFDQTIHKELKQISNNSFKNEKSILSSNSSFSSLDEILNEIEKEEKN